MINEMTKYAAGLIIDRLYDYADKQYFVSDLCSVLTETENIDGTVFYNTKKSLDFIAQNIFDAQTFSENYEAIFGTCPYDALFEPEKFTVLWLINEVDKLICNSNSIINRIGDDSKIYIDQTLISQIENEFKDYLK